jgi:hypothetical protein
MMSILAETKASIQEHQPNWGQTPLLERGGCGLGPLKPLRTQGG